MAKMLYRVFALITMSALLIAGCSAAESYIVGIDGDYPPYTYIDENGVAVGFDVESIQWIAEQNGFEVEIVPVAWDGIIPALLQNKIDMVYSGMTITPSRAAQVTFSIPYWIVDQGVVVREDSYVTMEQFEAGELIIGVQRSCSADQFLESDYFGAEKYDQLLLSGNIKLYDTFPQSMVALGQGLVEAVIFDDVNIRSYIQNKPSLVILDVIPTGEEYGVAMRNEDTELHEIINAGIIELMVSDKWDELLSKFIIEEDVVEIVDETVDEFEDEIVDEFEDEIVDEFEDDS
ncbi:MAG: ABC transporter substrate-binding protein [Euryarchaeota archaeon]|nr:ABC transporter substrate-binding protein [Euryarchaeota archaeon]